MIDSLSFAVGLIIGLVVETIAMVLLILWVACRSYELGWHDCEQDKWIGDNFQDFQTPPF